MTVTALHVRLIVPGVGALGFYAGALLGAFLAVRFERFGLVELLWAGAGGVIAALGALLAAEAALKPASSHLDTLKVLLYLSGAAAGVAAERAVAELWLGAAIPAFFEHLLIWAAGMAAARESEPGFVSWKTELGSLTGRPPS